MVSNKSIDGLSPRRKKPVTSVNADGFTPLQQPRKTSRGAKSTSGSSNTIHPEEFIPPRKTTKKSDLKPPEISNAPPKARRSTDIEEVNEDFLEPLKAFDFDEETGELVKAKDHPEPEKSQPKKAQKTQSKKGKKKKKWSKKRKIWTTIGIIFLVLIIGFVIWFLIWGSDLLAKLTGNRGNFFDFFSETYEPLKEDENGRTNILAFGTSGFDMEGTDFGGDIHDGAQLTDSIMAISFDQDTGASDLISLPRDLYIDAGCNYSGKVNEIYDCNNPEGTDENAGATALMQEVGQVLGIDFQYYAHVNWGALEDIVNDIGGITVTLDEPIFDYDYTGAVYDANTPYHLNGADAVGLSRARHGTENGDFTRGASQQKILLGIKDRIIQDGLTIPDLINLANTLGDNLRTNFSVGDMKTLAHLATTINWDNITEISLLDPEPLLTDGMINGISYVYPTAGFTDFSDIQAYLKPFLSSNPDAKAIHDEDATILVLNSTNTEGLAGTEQASLEHDSFVNVSVDNYSPATSTPYTLYTFTTEKPTTQKSLESKYNITAVDATVTPPADLPLDYDFILILGSQN